MIKTVIHFDSGGFYEETENGYIWNCSEGYNAIRFKTMCLEDITYSVLEERIRKKIDIDKEKKTRMSYIPLSSQASKPSYILDDEDVESYLLSTNEQHLRSIMHVEIENCTDENLRYVNYDGGEEEEHAITICVEEEHVDPLETACVEGGEVIGIEKMEVLNADVGVDGCGVDDSFEPHSDKYDGEQTQFVEEWDDGTGLEIGQEFGCKKEVKNMVFMASHRMCFDYDIVNSDKCKYVVRCRQQGCNWYLRASRPKGSEGSWLVRVHRKLHSCSRVSASTSNIKRRGSSDMVAEILQSDYPGQLDTPSAKSVVGLVQNKVGVKVSYRTALRGKHKAAWAVRGDPVESYRRLPSYLFVLEKTNLGTMTKLVLDEENRFKYLFIALGVCIEGFKCMRKVICVDATSLLNAYGGVLIFAVAQDPNRHHYPIAFAVGDGEKDATWKWFFTMLKNVVPDDSELVFISDRHASIIRAIREVYPRSHHGYCLYHLSMNVRSKTSNIHKDSVANKFRELGQIYTKAEFDREYAEFRRRYPKVADYLDESVDVEKWARSYFPGNRYNISTTNCAESLNNVFKEARKYSLLIMIDVILEKFGEWFNKHRNDCTLVHSSQKLVPVVEKKLHDLCKDAMYLGVEELNVFTGEYRVLGRDMRYLVNLEAKTCACERFDKDKYPCVHAIAAQRMYMNNPNRREDKNLHELCSKYYLMDVWTLAYLETLFPVPDIFQWHGIPDDIVGTIVLPPNYTKKKGRRQENRFPSVGESRRKTKNKPTPSVSTAAEVKRVFLYLV